MGLFDFVRYALNQFVQVTSKGFADLIKVFQIHPHGKLVVILIDRSRANTCFS